MIIINNRINVIVPIYNSEQFIERCINSITNQTYHNWQLLLVDDGSIDRSLEIIKNCKKNDNRIVIITQSNQGAGAARNTALDYLDSKNIKNEYIVFVDSDDYIENDYLYELSKHNEDVVFIDVLQRNEDGKILKKEIISDYKNRDINVLIRRQMTGYIPWGGVRKAVKSNVIFDNDIRYSKCKMGEEAIYSFLVTEKSNSIGFVSKPVYNYEIHESSLSNSKSNDPWGETYENIKKELISLSLYEKYASTLNSFNITSTIVSIDRISRYYSINLMIKKLKERKKQYFKRYNKNYGIDYKSLRPKALLLVPFIKLRWFLIIGLICKIKNSIN